MLHDKRSIHHTSIGALTYPTHESLAVINTVTTAKTHRPVIPWTWLHRITHARYYAYIAFPLLLTLYILSLTHLITTFALFLFALLLLILLCTCELTRYDRATCRHLMRQFETLFVCGYTIIHTVTTHDEQGTRDAAQDADKS